MTKTSPSSTDSVASAPRGPAAVVQPLADTLAAELESLHALHSLTADQLAALQNADSDTLDALTSMVGETLARMKRLQQTRGRQTRLAARVLKLSTDTVTIEEIATALAAYGDEDSLRAADELTSHRAELRERATVASRKADALTFALHHALTLGREVLTVLQGQAAPAGQQHYTPTGMQPGASRGGGFVNSLG
jgi:hypothetical protein